MTESQEFCPNCGTRRAAPAAPYRPPAAPPSSPARGKTGIWVVVIVLAAVLVIGIIAAAILLSAPGDQTGQTVTIDSVTVEDRPLSVAVPDPGNQIVSLRLVMTNHASSDVALSVGNFDLEVEGGAVYPATDKVATDMPPVLAGGTTESFVLAFEVPQDAVPLTVHFDGTFA